MPRRPLEVVALLCLALALPLIARAQQPAPPVFTFVAEWDVQRDKWADVSAFMDKGIRPIFDRLIADGTISGYGTYETLVHEKDGSTHGMWWTATSLVGIEKARLEAIKVPPPAALATAAHHDYFMRGLIGNHRPGSGAGGYLRVNSSLVQAGKGNPWRETWEKYTKPAYDALVADGTLAYYSVEIQQVATENPGVRMVVAVAPSAEAMDKVYAALTALTAKRSPEERAAVDAAFMATIVPDASRSYLARVNAFSFK